jgi:hypothetical protein
MEEGGKTKKTIFVGGIGEDVDEHVILEAFSTFGGSCWRWRGRLPCLNLLFPGDIIDVQLPTNATGRPHENRVSTATKYIATLAHLYSRGSEASRLCLRLVFIRR